MKLQHSIRILLFPLFFTLLFLLVPHRGVSQDVQDDFDIIVIDAGHGGRLPGAISRSRRVKEKDVVLAIAKILAKKIEYEMPELKIYMTRDKDVHVDLLDRANLANKTKADLFISIHCNASRSSKAFGTETYIAGSHRLDEQDEALRENIEILQEENFLEKYGGYDPTKPETFIIMSLSKNKYRAQSLQFAKMLEEKFRSSGRHSRGAKEKGLIILQRCGRPGVLVEVGFLSNSQEEKYLSSKSGQEQIATLIFDAIVEYKSLITNKLN